METISEASYEDLLELSKGKYRISCYSVSGGISNTLYGDTPGNCDPYEDSAVLALSRQLKAQNAVFVKLSDGSAWLVAEKFDTIQTSLAEGIKKLGTPNGTGIGYEFYSILVESPLFFSGTPIIARPKGDYRGYSKDTYWDAIQFVCP